MDFTCHLKTESELLTSHLCFILLFPSQPWYFTLERCVRKTKFEIQEQSFVCESKTGSGNRIYVSWRIITFYKMIMFYVVLVSNITIYWLLLIDFFFSLKRRKILHGLCSQSYCSDLAYFVEHAFIGALRERGSQRFPWLAVFRWWKSRTWWRISGSHLLNWLFFFFKENVFQMIIA